MYIIQSNYNNFCQNTSKKYQIIHAKHTYDVLQLLLQMILKQEEHPKPELQLLQWLFLLFLFCLLFIFCFC